MALVSGSCYGQPLAVATPELPEPLSYGLFSVAESMPTENAHWQQGVEWQPYSCAVAGATPCPTCAQNAAGTAPEKTYEDTPDAVAAFPFTVYGSFACSPFGHWDDAVLRARKLLQSGAERAVELEIGANGVGHGGRFLTAAGSVDVTPTPGTPVTLAQGLAILEDAGADRGNGQFVIMANRREVTLLNANGPLIYPTGAQLRTTLGTPVAALSGFDARVGPNAVAAGAGQAWLFATGTPRIWRSEVFVTSERDQALKTATNDLEILAEQTYVVGWDCFTIGVLVTSV